jgi:hypothetical protein
VEEKPISESDMSGESVAMNPSTVGSNPAPVDIGTELATSQADDY